MTPSSPESGPHQQPRSSLANGAIVAVVLVYAIFAAAWILLSDQALQLLFVDPEQMIIASMLKGWFFVGVTSLLLYLLMRHWVVEAKTPKMPALPLRHLSTLFICLLSVITLFTLGGISNFYQHEKTDEINRLFAIMELKDLQITDWVQEQQKGAEFVMSSERFAELYLSWQQQEEPQSSLQLQNRLESVRQTLNLHTLALLDPRGKLLWSSDNSNFNVHPAITEAAQVASNEHKIIALNPYREATGKAYFDFIIPLAVIATHSPLIVFHIDLQHWLFPILLSWTAPEHPGKVELYVRKQQHYEPFPAMPVPPAPSGNATTSITTQLLHIKPAGNTIIHALDQQGHAILGMARPISNTDWVIVLEREQEKFYAEVIQHSAWIGFVGLFALFLSSAAYYLIRQSQKLALSEAVHQTQANQLQALQLLATLSDSSEDAIFAKDLQGRYILFNRAASALIGKNVTAIIGKDDHALFPQEQAEWVMNHDRSIIAAQQNVFMEEELDTVLGKRNFHTIKGPLRDANNTIIGTYGIARDITALKHVERALRESEARLRLTIDATNDGLWDWNLQNNSVFLTEKSYAILGYQTSDITPNLEFWRQSVHPDDLERVLSTMRAHVQGQTELSELEYRVITPTGAIKWISGKGKVVEKDNTGAPCRMLGTLSDISARKVAEEALRQQTEELERRNAELERFNRIMVGRELDMITLKQQINELALKLGQESPYPLKFLAASAELQAINADANQPGALSG